MSAETREEIADAAKVASVHDGERLGTTPRTSELGRIPALDGLRGLAVASVLCFHAGNFLPGGFLGVDLFFVLSGYLITALLISEHASTGKVDLIAFWSRRARRLFPALLSLMLIVPVYAALFARWTELPGLRRDALATLAYVANWAAIYSNRSYWDLFATPSVLEHTWSLAIEEQFYLIWPILLAVLFRLAAKPTRALLPFAVALCVASAVSMVLLYEEGGARAYYGTDARGAAILLGAVVAASMPIPIAFSKRLAAAVDIAAVGAALGIGYAWFVLDGQSWFLYHGGFWLTELGAVVLILASTQGERSFVARALSFSPLRRLGDISYGLYLWHWPVFVVLSEERTHLNSPLVLNGLRFAVTYLIAAVSYRFLEQPIRKRSMPHATLALASAIALSVALNLIATREPPVPKAATPSEGPLPDLRTMPAASTLPPLTMRVLMLGDSVASALGHAMRGVQGESHAFVAVRGRDDCSILEGAVITKSLLNKRHQSGNCAEDWARDVAELRPDATVVVLGGGFYAPALLYGVWTEACNIEWTQVYLKEFVRRLRSLRPYGGRIFVAQVPEPVGGWAARPGLNDRVDCFNDVMDEAARRTGAQLIDLQTYLCPGHSCTLRSRGELVRPDGMHFDGPGAADTAKWMLQAVRTKLR